MVKDKKVFRILAVTLTLALLLMAIPASLVLAAASLNLTPDEGEVGDDVQVNGTGFNTGLSLILYFSSQPAEVGDDINTDVTIYKQVNTAGTPVSPNFVKNFLVPEVLSQGPGTDEDVHDGRYYVYVTNDISEYILAKAYFTVVGFGTIELSDDEGTVGTEIDITGGGFAADEDLSVEFGGDEVDIESGDEVTDEDGEFILSIIIPDAIFGDHTIAVIGGESLAEVSDTFTVMSDITVNPVQGLPGDELTLYGTGFDKRNGVDFYFGGTPITVEWIVDAARSKTNNDGYFAVKITVPDVDVGAYTILAEDEDDDDISAQVTFTVTEPSLNPVIVVDPTSANVDDEVEVSGTEFAPGDTVTIYFDDEVVDTTTTLTDGSFTGSFDIPESVNGSHTIKAEDTDGGVATATITVEPKIAFDIEEGPGGTEVTVTGTGFGYRSDIETIEFDSTDVDIESGDDRSGTDGSFEFSFIVPAVGAGSYDVTVEDEDGNSAEAEFTVVAAAASITPTSGVGGTEITVTGVNFIAGAEVTISYDGVDITTATAGSDGTVSATFDAPAGAGGVHNVTISDGINDPDAEFTVTAEASINPVSGNVGSAITVSGNGFGASKPITITYDGSVVTPMATIVTLVDGSFSGSFIAPVSTGGSHVITVSDGVNPPKQFTFTMETTKPPTPQQLPLGTDKPKQPITFDWSDVTDASMPVTYSLQVATDASYGNIVIDKMGLAGSEYTLLEEEELEPVGKDSPYYWRISSTDAASNSSDWGPSATFYIGGGWPGWLMWLWIGLGALTLGIFFFWLGRRIAFSSY